MSIDMLLFLIRVSRSILVSESELWPASTLPAVLTRDLRRGLRRHRRALRAMKRQGDYRVCCDPWLHWRYGLRYDHYRFAGQGQIVCEICERWERGRMMTG